MHPAIGKIVIVKFFSNVNKHNSSKLITKTLGKVGFISRDYAGTLPHNEEFWKCSIVDEITPGQNKGCWVLTPLEKIPENEVQKLIPGFYDEQLIEGILYIYPNENGNWILPLVHKKSISDIYSILVCVDRPETFNC